MLGVDVIAVELAVALSPLPATVPVLPAPPIAFSISVTMPLLKPLTASDQGRETAVAAIRAVDTRAAAAAGLIAMAVLLPESLIALAGLPVPPVPPFGAPVAPVVPVVPD